MKKLRTLRLGKNGVLKKKVYVNIQKDFVESKYFYQTDLFWSLCRAGYRLRCEVGRVGFSIRINRVRDRAKARVRDRVMDRV